MSKDKLLFGRAGQSQLFVYDHVTGQYLSTIPTIGNYEPYDALWTPTGNIVYTTLPVGVHIALNNSNKKKGRVVYHLFESGAAKDVEMTRPSLLSISDEGEDKPKKIYLADYNDGVFESTNDGVKWNLIFKPTDEWHCWQVIKVKNDEKNDVFWTLERRGDKRRLRVYIRNSDKDFTEKNISLTTIDGKHINLSKSSLAYDGNRKIFLSERDNKAVHVLSVDGHYKRQLLSSHDIKNEPWRLAVYGESLYVGQYDGVVEEFPLTSEKDDR